MHRFTSRTRARRAAVALVGGLLATFAIAPAAQAVTSADLKVASPNTAPYGKSYSQWGAAWWKWVLEQPAATNPLEDSTGANCQNGQSGPVFFLAGSFANVGAVQRTCTVQFGKALVIPVVNAINAAFPGETTTVAELRAGIAPSVKAATALTATIDGSPVTNVSRYYEDSTVFSATLPADNLFGLPAGQVLNPAVDAGYYLFIYPQLPGKHTLRVTGTIDGDSVDVTYKLNISLFG